MKCITLLGLAHIYLAAGVLGFIWFGLDKYMASIQGNRIPEKSMLLLSLAFGWIGGVIAMLTFRHKTQKNSFKVKMAVMIVGNISLVIWLLLGVECNTQLAPV